MKLITCSLWRTVREQRILQISEISFSWGSLAAELSGRQPILMRVKLTTTNPAPIPILLNTIGDLPSFICLFSNLQVTPLLYSLTFSSMNCIIHNVFVWGGHHGDSWNKWGNLVQCFMRWTTWKAIGLKFFSSKSFQSVLHGCLKAARGLVYAPIAQPPLICCAFLFTFERRERDQRASLGEH